VLKRQRPAGTEGEIALLVSTQFFQLAARELGSLSLIANPGDGAIYDRSNLDRKKNLRY
jgi:hypothetical protein